MTDDEIKNYRITITVADTIFSDNPTAAEEMANEWATEIKEQYDCWVVNVQVDYEG